MQTRNIIFTKLNTAELLTKELDENVTGSNALLRTEYTAISAGTERDNLTGEPNTVSTIRNQNAIFPTQFGYSGVATVLAAGPACKKVKPGDRVVVYFGKHSEYQVMNESNLFIIPYDEIDLKQAALFVIAGFPAEGVRKTRLEFGESAMVMGLGILGLIAIQLCRAAGAVPVIAADPDPERRALAIKTGADIAVDPLESGFEQKIRELTDGKGVDVAVDAAGRASATTQALECMARFGRISLLGCTRHHGEYDLYHLVHGVGVTIVGANNFARPNFESRPGNWTAADDCSAVQKLVHLGRIDLMPLIDEIHSPKDAPEVYSRLALSGKFPIGVLFDWSKIK